MYDNYSANIYLVKDCRPIAIIEADHADSGYLSDLNSYAIQIVVTV